MRRRVAGAFAVALLVFVTLLLLVLRFAGRWLIVDEPLQSARAIVVIGGQMPFRAMEAANLYRQGWAPEVWLTQNTPSEGDYALKALGVEKPQEFEYSRRVLMQSGVPETSIRVVLPTVENTAQEIRAIAKETRGADGRLILVTSKYHSRRLKALWRALEPAGAEPIVHVAPGDPFQPDGWWRSTRDAEWVAHEWFGLLNAWMGFPLQSVAR